MEISLRLILIATLLMITAAIVLGVMTGQVGGFTDFLDQRSQDANCKFLETKYERAQENENTERYREINDKAVEKGCTWAGSDEPQAGPGSCGEGKMWCEVAKSCVEEGDYMGRCND